MPLVLLGAPVFWSPDPDTARIIALGLVTLIWIGFRKFRSPALKITSLSLLFIVLVFSILYFNGVLDLHFHFDFGRTVISDAGYLPKIREFQSRALYLPYKFRPLVWGLWTIPADLVSRAVSWLWLDNFLNSIGLAATVFFIIGAVKSRHPAAWSVIITGVLATVISRNPDTSLSFLLLAPPLLTLTVSGTKYLKTRFIYPLLALGIIYLVVA